MPFVSLDQLTTARVQWLWPGRLPIGYLTIFDGDPGIGKSLLTLDLAARITTGRPFPEGTAASAPASVIILNAEDGGSGVISGRLQAAGADLSRVQIFDRSVGEAFLRLPGHLPRLEEAIVRKQVRYVVIDPILGYLDERDRGRGRYSDPGEPRWDGPTSKQRAALSAANQVDRLRPGCAGVRVQTRATGPAPRTIMKLRSLIREVCRLGHAEWAFDRAEHLMNKPLPMCFERALTVLEEAGIEVDQLLE